MSVTYDFSIITTDIPGLSQVVPQNEKALLYLVQEADMTVIEDGSAVLFDEKVGDFISDASWAHMACELVD